VSDDGDMMPIVILGLAGASVAAWWWWSQRSQTAAQPAPVAPPGAGSEPQLYPPSYYTPPYTFPATPPAPAAGVRSVSAAGLQHIKNAEGLRLSAYPDAGGHSIGYGHHIQAGETFNGPIPIGRANQLFTSDIAHVQQIINSHVRVPLSQGEYDALADLVFNEGHIPPTLLKKLNAGDYAGAQAEFSRNVYSQGQINHGLVMRREADANLWATG
jgi:GH24 family phage-related lysozyme (muramidase)